MDWIITKDPDHQKQYTGRYEGDFHNCVKFPSIAELNALAAAMPFEFRLLDGDGEVYYEGKCGHITDAFEEDAFEPQDYFESYAGVVETQFRKVGDTEWETL